MNGKTAPSIDIAAPAAFSQWLLEQRVSVLFSTYQTGSLVALGVDDNGHLAVESANLEYCMGLWAAPAERSLWVAARDYVWRYTDILPAGQRWAQHDAIFAPQASWVTGDLDTHDLVRERDGRMVFANTRYNCLATTSEAHHFSPLWQPSFTSGLEVGDRCHLNGIAVKDGEVTHVSVLARTDTPQGWRDAKADGGALIDTASGEVVLAGLSMPHSPRWADGRLWVLESGTGQLGWVDLARGRFEPVVFCPGYPRGLAFIGHYALIGLSLPREQSGFGGLALQDALERRGLPPRCGLLLVDLRNPDNACVVEVSGAVQELYDVAVMPGVRHLRWIGLDSEDLHYFLGLGPPTTLWRPPA